MVVEHSDRVDFTLPVDEPRRVGWLASHYLSYVRDNSLWIPSGPIDGGRLASPPASPAISPTAGSTASSSAATGATISASAAGAPGRFAPTGSTAAATGPRRVNIGGTLGLRGYPQFGYIVGSEAFMFNQELRFPLLTHLTLGTPFGDIDLPEIQAGLFTDVGNARSPPPPTARCSAATALASAWRSDRSTVLRLDLGPPVQQ